MFNQQDAVYAAEARTDFSAWLGTLRDCQIFVDELRESDWWEECIGESLLFVDCETTRAKHSHAETHVEDSHGILHLNQFGYTTRTVIHELAHCIARVLHGSQSHDPWWCRVYLELVSLVVGPDAYLQLSQAFSTGGVEVAAEGMVFRRKDVIAL